MLRTCWVSAAFHCDHLSQACETCDSRAFVAFELCSRLQALGHVKIEGERRSPLPIAVALVSTSRLAELNKCSLQ